MPTPKLPQGIRQKIIDLKAKGLTNTAIAKKLNVATGTVSNVINTSQVNADLEINNLKNIVRDSKRQYRDAMKIIKNLRHELSLFVGFKEYAQSFKPINIRPKYGKKGEATAVICANDWHLEEEVDPAAVEGVNAYNKKIAERRIKRLWQAGASLVDMCRSRSKIDTIVVNVMGDLISGWIHDPLMVTNYCTPPEASLLAFDYLISGIDFLLKECKPKELVVVFVTGNHSRMTKRKFTKISPKTTFEWIIYNMVVKMGIAKGWKNVRFKLPSGDINYFKVYNKLVRVTHGDNIRYRGGIGGVHIPLRKSLDRWNTAKRADYNYIAHWHTDLTGEDYRISGSAIGYSEFSMIIKAPFQRPTQAFEIIHPRYGPTARFPIILE